MWRWIEGVWWLSLLKVRYEIMIVPSSWTPVLIAK